MENHDEETHSEPDMIEVRQREARQEWVIAIREKLEQAMREEYTTILGKRCIYIVPDHLRGNLGYKPYFPQTVSLGPYHHGKMHLCSMESHKWRAVSRVLSRTNQHIEMYIDAMKELEEKARACYQGPIGMSCNRFTEMLVLDGCFVLELFRGSVEGFQEIGYAPNDPVFAIRGFIVSIRQDMLMLENQLPMFVLNRLLELQLGTRSQTGIVTGLAVRFFEPLMPTFKKSTKLCQSKLANGLEKSIDSLSDEGELHCLDVFRRSLFHSSQPFRQKKLTREITIMEADNRQYQMAHCVTELRYASIKFRRKKTDQFWDIGFKKGYLEIPKLLVHEGTKSFFLNLIAFEHCHVDSSNNASFYMLFMEKLISSHEDVSHLHDCGIIEHCLESNSDVVDMFKGLCQEVAFDPRESYLSRLSYEVNNYHKNNAYKATLRHKYLDTLKERYFNNPWAYLTFIAAFLLLVLTFTQTFFTVYPYYNPRS